MFHRCKYGKVEEGYQYCIKCGKAILAPVVKCQHVWEEKEIIRLSEYGYQIGTKYIDRCEKCGELKITSTRSDNS